MTSSDAQIITFYSYKGGTGRSMHLANVAWILASNGKRVLMVDWDLEAPGLHRYFQPFLIDKEVTATDGLIDLMWDFSDAAMTAVPEAQRAPGWHQAYADIVRCTAAIRWGFPAPGRLDLLSAGRQGPSYSSRVTSFNWQNFYDRLGGGVFLESVKAGMRKEYDYVLIDSRTGVTDTAGICTVQMPDALVVCFTANNQSIEGCAAIAQSVRAQWTANGQRTDHRRIVPLLTRVDGSEKDKLNARRKLVRTKFDAYIPGMAAGTLDDYWRNIEVPYVPWYSYEEVLAVFADKYREKISVLDSAEALTQLLTHGEITSAVRPSDMEREAVLAQSAGADPPVTVTRPTRAPDAAVGSPYPGLQPFSRDNSEVFFGRNTESEELAERLRSGQRELYVVGPSGSGKSSLVRAGLIPLLERSPERGPPRFLILLGRPGELPLTQLAAALQVDQDADASVFASAVEAVLARHPGYDRILIVIDQVEELFTLASNSQRDRMFDAICALRQQPRLALLLIVRADSYGLLLSSPLEVGDDRPPAVLRVTPLRNDGLREAIVGPARTMGARVEPALVERLLADAADEPGSLPLLQETLAQLWSRAEGGVLTAAQYAELGDRTVSGLARAMARRAAATYINLDIPERDVARRILLRLVSFVEGRAATRRRQLRDELAAGQDGIVFDRTLRTLVDQRLLTTDVNDTGAVQVDLASESLIAAWPTLRGWIETLQADEQRRRELESSAALWNTSARRNAYTLDPARTRAALQWLGSGGVTQVGFSEDVRALVAASQKARSRRTRSFYGYLVLTITSLVVAISGIVDSREHTVDSAENQRLFSARLDVAHRQLANSYLAQGRALLVRDQGAQAAQYFLAARELGVDDIATRTSFRWASWQIPELSLYHRIAVTEVLWSPDGEKLATATDDGTVRVWDAGTGKRLALAMRHRAAVRAMAWSADATKLATASADGTAAVWTVAGKPIAPGFRHKGAVVALGWSPDGSRLATASDDGTARIWDAATAKPITPPLLHPAAVRAVAWSPDGTRLATASADGTARIWDAVTGKPTAPSFRHTSAVLDVGWSPDAKMLTTIDRDYGVRIWSTSTGHLLSPPFDPTAPNRAVARSPNGSKLAAVGPDGTVMIVNQGGVISKQFTPPVATHSISWNQKGTRLATMGDDQIIRIWDILTGQEVSVAFALSTVVTSVALNPDGTRMAAAGRDGSVRLWRVRPLLAGLARLAHDAAVQSVAWSADGTAITTADDSGVVRLWDAKKGVTLTTSESLPKPGASSWSRDASRVATEYGGTGYGGAAYGGTGNVRDLNSPTASVVCSLPIFRHGVALAISPDGTRLATYSSDDGHLKVWKILNAHMCIVTATSYNRADQADIAEIVWNPDGTRIATASVDKNVRIWDMSGRNVSSLTHKASVFALAWSPDGTRLATASADRIARVWNASTGALVSAMPAHQDQLVALAWSPDGTRLATASSDRSARVWSATSGASDTPPLMHADGVVALAWSPDGSRLATAAGDHGLRIWDAVLGQPLCPPIFHAGGITGLAWSPDGTRLATSADDNFAQIWDLAADNGSLADWSNVVGTSPYVLAPSGMLVPRELPPLDEAQ